MGVSAGALFTSRTTTTKLWVALRLGIPLSVTTTVMVLVPGPCDSAGGQVNTPVPAAIEAPVGGDSRLKVSACTGKSLSVAKLFTVKVAPSSIVWSAIEANTGA